MGFSRQEYWSGLPFPPPGDLSNTEIELRSLALQADSLLLLLLFFTNLLRQILSYQESCQYRCQLFGLKLFPDESPLFPHHPEILQTPTQIYYTYFQNCKTSPLYMISRGHSRCCELNSIPCDFQGQAAHELLPANGPEW